MRIQKLSRLLVILFATAALPACAGPVTYSAEPIEAWVVDAETKLPIEDAVIVAHWVLEGGIHADRVGELMILETVTDKNGRFYFPGWGPIRHWGRSRLTYMDPEIIIFKSGYEHRRLTNEMTKEAIGGKAFPLRRSTWSGRKITLKKFTGTPKQWLELLERSLPGLTREDAKQFPTLLQAILAEESSVPDSIGRKRPFFDNVRRLLQGK